MSKRVFWSLFAVVLGLGLALRLPRLDARPMHHDEANQAVKFGALLETGQYRYDPADHHGPTLYYLTLPAAWLRGQATLASLDERTLRLVPAIFGAATILMFALFAAGLGRAAVVGAALLAAISPALTYYSRFYIQETLLVFFALGFLVAIGRCALERRFRWALAAGVFAGLAFATKETSVKVLPPGLLACFAACRILRLRPRLPAAHVLAAIVAALVVAAGLYSSFGSNPGGVLASVNAFSSYIGRGVQPTVHAEPWSYYLRLLAWSPGGGLVWTEGLVLLLALVGMISACGRLRVAPQAPGTQYSSQHPAPSTEHAFWPIYISLYSCLSCIAFSAIRYKTPWNLLPFYVGFVLMAGYGVATLMRLTRRRAATGVTGPLPLVASATVAVVLLAAAMHLARQDWRANFSYGADARNPYAYLHTSPDFLRLVKRVQDLAAVHADDSRMLVKVVAGPYEQWPLPWYLRRMSRVGYWTTAASAAPFDGTPVIIASAENAPALDAALGDRYQSEFYGLRPDVLLTLYIERGLWEKFLTNSAFQTLNHR